MPKHALAGGKKNIRRNKSPYGRIVVATLQVIEPGLRIVYICSITERVLCSQSARQRTGARDLPAPAVIGVFYYGIVVAANRAENIVIPVANIAAKRAVVVAHGCTAACVIVESLRSSQFQRHF